MKLLYLPLILLGLTFGAFAADFAVVDYQAVLQKSKAFDSFQKQVADNRTTLEAQFSKESETLKSLEKSIIDKRAEYSELELNKKRAEFEAKVEAFKTKFQSKQAEFEANNTAAVKTIETQMQKIIAEVVKEEKFDIVYQAAALAYYDKTKDVSEKVLKKLDSSLPKVSLKKVS